MDSLADYIVQKGQFLLNLARQFTFKDAIDVIIVTILIYSAIKLVRETRAGQLVKGIIILVVIFLLSSQFELLMLSTILRTFFQFAFLALLIVFQPEIRKALEQMEKYRAGGDMGGMIYDGKDELTGHTRGYGAHKTKPGDYLNDFAAYLKSHANEIAALHIICTRPKDLTKAQLKELLLTLDANGFTALQLNDAYSEYTNSTMVAGIISLIRRYMLGTELVSKNSQLSRAFDKLNRKHKFTPAQQKWLDIIRSYMQQQDILSVEAFKEDKRLQRLGGYARAQKIFADDLDNIVSEFNGYLYEDGGKTA